MAVQFHYIVDLAVNWRFAYRSKGLGFTFIGANTGMIKTRQTQINICWVYLLDQLPQIHGTEWLGNILLGALDAPSKQLRNLVEQPRPVRVVYN